MVLAQAGFSGTIRSSSSGVPSNYHGHGGRPAISPNRGANVEKARMPLEITGFVLESSDSDVVKFSWTPSGSGGWIEIRGSGVLSESTNEDTGLVTLTLGPDAQVRNPSALEREPGTERLDEKPSGPTPSEIAACVTRKRQECKTDPTVRDKRFCDSVEAGVLYEFSCTINSPSWGPVVA